MNDRNVTDADIEALGIEARNAGDYEQASLCVLALNWDDEARAACVEAILAARGMADDDRDGEGDR